VRGLHRKKNVKVVGKKKIRARPDSPEGAPWQGRKERVILGRKHIRRMLKNGGLKQGLPGGERRMSLKKNKIVQQTEGARRLPFKKEPPALKVERKTTLRMCIAGEKRLKIDGKAGCGPEGETSAL